MVLQGQHYKPPKTTALLFQKCSKPCFKHKVRVRPPANRDCVIPMAYRLYDIVQIKSGKYKKKMGSLSMAELNRLELKWLTSKYRSYFAISELLGFFLYFFDFVDWKISFRYHTVHVSWPLDPYEMRETWNISWPLLLDNFV